MAVYGLQNLAGQLTFLLAQVAATLTKGAQVANSRGDLMPKNAMLDMLRDLGAPLPEGWFEDFVARRLVEYRTGVDPISGAIDAVRAVQAAGIPLAIAAVRWPWLARPSLPRPPAGWSLLMASPCCFQRWSSSRTWRGRIR